MTVFWLDLSPLNSSRWIGWRCVKPNRGRYHETPVIVADLETLPEWARVYLAGYRWRRP